MGKNLKLLTQLNTIDITVKETNKYGYGTTYSGIDNVVSSDSNERW